MILIKRNVLFLVCFLVVAVVLVLHSFLNIDGLVGLNDIVYPTQKIHSYLMTYLNSQGEKIPSSLVNDDGTWNVRIICEKETEISQCEKSIIKYGAIIQQPSPFSFDVAVSRNKIYDMASEETIIFIEEANPPIDDEMNRKVSKSILYDGISDWAKNHDGTANFTVIFTKDTLFGEAVQIIRKHCGYYRDNIEGIPVTESKWYNSLIVIIDEDEVLNLAREDKIKWIDEVPPEPVIY